MELCQGHWTEATDLIRQALQRSGERETTSRAVDMLILGRLGMRRGDADTGQTLNEAVGSSSEAFYAGDVGIAAATVAEAAWLRGDHQRVIEATRATYDRAVSQHIPWLAGELAFWRWRAGEVFTPPEWIAKPYALQIAGDWRGAAKEWESRGCPYEQATALMDGDERAQLAALEIFERLGARPIIEKLKQKMRAEGMRSIPRGPRPATRENRFGLTAREMEVLPCLVKGSSNNAIARQLSLSTRTVEHHIASMLQKTGAQSRNELVALALKEGLLPAGQVSPTKPSI
jgi:DNA-binding CsgD family transcriptional regulator